MRLAQWIGVFLEPTHHSIRASRRKTPESAKEARSATLLSRFALTNNDRINRFFRQRPVELLDELQHFGGIALASDFLDNRMP